MPSPAEGRRGRTALASIFPKSILFLILLIGLVAVSKMCTGSDSNKLWVTGYWYSPNVWGNLPASDIDYDGLTHIAHYAVMPKGDGSLDPQLLKAINDYAPGIIDTAHNNGVKVLLSIAQVKLNADFKGATAPDNLETFIANILDVVDSHGYDGVDLDWETNVVSEQFKNLAQGLRMQLDQRTPRKELTGAFFSAPTYLGEIQHLFDQINVMAYDMCSPEDGFSWHNAALYSGWDRRRRSVDSRVGEFVSRLDRRKLGLGLPFYGYFWQGGYETLSGAVTGPGQTWVTAPKTRALAYRDIIKSPALWREEFKRRDQKAGEVPYLAVDPSHGGTQGFVTYDDEISVTEKVKYARDQGLGGLMIWELSADYLPNRSPAHPLFEALKTANRKYNSNE
jgi:chitinase